MSGVDAWNVEALAAPADAPPGAPGSIRVSRKDDSPGFSGSYPIQFVRGVAYPAWCSEQRRDKLQGELALRSDDVLVVSYPKCGTTWAEQCILLLQNRGDTSKMDPAAKNVYVPSSKDAPGKIWPEACIDQNPAVHLRTGLEFVPITVQDFDEAPAPRTIKSHAPPHLLLTGNNGSGGGGVGALPRGVKVLVVTRNPLDACVSSYYHAWNPSKSGWPFDAWAAAWLSGNVPHGCWFEWVKAWKAQADAAAAAAAAAAAEGAGGVLWLQFEDLKADPTATVRRVAAFLDPALAADDALIAQVVQASSFEAMREQATAGGSGSGSGPEMKKKEGGDVGHLRKGVAGDWRNHFSPAVKADFEAKYAAKLAGTGIVFSLGAGEGTMEAP